MTATASDDVGVVGVQFLLDGQNLGTEDANAPYSTNWASTTAADGSHTLQAQARDSAGHVTTSSPVAVTVANGQSTGLAAAWSFDQASGSTATDSSGNGNTATLVNGVGRTPGTSGGGLTLDGVDDYVNVPNSPSLNISGKGLTLRMSIKPLAGGGDSVVVSKSWGTTMTSPYYQYGLELAGGTEPNFFIGGSGGIQAVSIGLRFTTNQWSDLAISFNGVEVKFFVNGALVKDATLITSITARGNALHVGADAQPGQFFKGSLDELRIYNRALTTAELASGSHFQNDVLTVGLSLPTTIAFLPGGKMLVGELRRDTYSWFFRPTATPSRTPSCSSRTSAAQRARTRACTTVAVDPDVHVQPLHLRLLHAGHAQSRPAVTVHRQRSRSPVPAASCVLYEDAERQRRRPPRRRDHVRQRRHALPHDRRAVRRPGCRRT